MLRVFDLLRGHRGVAVLASLLLAGSAYGDLVRNGQRKELKKIKGGEWKAGDFEVKRSKYELGQLLCRVEEWSDESLERPITVTVTDKATGNKLAVETRRYPHLPLDTNFANGTITVRVSWPDSKVTAVTGFCAMRYICPGCVEAGETE